MSALVALALAGQLIGATAGIFPVASAEASASVTPVVVAGPSFTGQAQPQLQFDTTRFDSLTALSLHSLLEIAVENGLPTRPLINLAYQGAARRASGARILVVVREHMAAMGNARDALGAATPANELDAGASALRAGLDARTLSAVRATRAYGAAEVPLVVLTDIFKRGVPLTAARDAVTALARMPGSDDALRGLQSTVARNAPRGPGMAVDALNRYLRGAVSGAPPSSAPATTDRTPIRPPSP